ncbi:MAG: DUF4262 domain-containing protein [Bacteroidota bacterium]
MSDQNHVDHDKLAEERIIQDVELYGFHIALLPADDYLPAFAYTIGLYQNHQHPEFIVFGLSTDVMGRLLQQLGLAVKKGQTFQAGMNHADILANHPVHFLSVDKAHYRDYLGYCGWFYKQSFEFPCQQLVWPDKAGLFPWEEGFYDAWKFQQPLLDRNADFKFYEERNLGVYTTQATLDGRPILRVSHEEEGGWQFHSELEPDVKNARVVSLGELVKRDPSLNELFYLNYGQYAFRKDVNSDWEVFHQPTQK